MTTFYQFFLYLPLYVSTKVGYLDIDYTLRRAADRWNFDYRLALASGDAYGDPRELGVLIVGRDTQEQADALISQIGYWFPLKYEAKTPAEALALVRNWGAPEAYFEDGQLVKP